MYIQMACCDESLLEIQKFSFFALDRITCKEITSKVWGGCGQAMVLGNFQ